MVKRNRLRRSLGITLATDVFREVDRMTRSGYSWGDVVSHIAHKYFGGDESRAEVWLQHSR